MWVNIQSEVTVKLRFDQLVVETHDGYLQRNVTEFRRMQFKDSVFSSKKRTTTSDRYLRILIEITEDVILVKRLYPNLIDLFSGIGRIIKVFTLVSVLIATFHNQIRYGQIVQNEIMMP